jgi:hypothetical protein
VIHMDAVYTSGIQDAASTHTDWMPSGKSYTNGWWLDGVDQAEDGVVRTSLPW